MKNIGVTNSGMCKDGKRKFLTSRFPELSELGIERMLQMIEGEQKLNEHSLEYFFNNLYSHLLAVSNYPSAKE